MPKGAANTPATSIEAAKAKHALDMDLDAPLGEDEVTPTYPSSPT
jgi:hypothetical protein